MLTAVRVGDVPAFQKAFQTHEATFLADQTHFLILRLRHFVIKTALRTITLAYSRISLADVCVKLHLDSEEDTEYIVAKAIKDGVINATIDHQGGFMECKVAGNVIETDMPQKEFDKRVHYCTQVYNESVRVSTCDEIWRAWMNDADSSYDRLCDIRQMLIGKVSVIDFCHDTEIELTISLRRA